MIDRLWHRLLCRLGRHWGRTNNGAFRCDFCDYIDWYNKDRGAA